MKSYKNVELFAKNAPAGSYAAGCPAHHRVWGGFIQDASGNMTSDCTVCEIAH